MKYTGFFLLVCKQNKRKIFLQDIIKNWNALILLAIFLITFYILILLFIKFLFLRIRVECNRLNIGLSFVPITVETSLISKKLISSLNKFNQCYLYRAAPN